jgi:hypothetical protein
MHLATRVDVNFYSPGVVTLDRRIGWRCLLFSFSFLKRVTALFVPWRDSISRSIALISLMAGGDDATRPKPTGRDVYFFKSYIQHRKNYERAQLEVESMPYFWPDDLSLIDKKVFFSMIKVLKNKFLYFSHLLLIENIQRTRKGTRKTKHLFAVDR